MIYKYNNRKYDFGGAIGIRATLTVIPEDEPVFILRGKDVHAIEALEIYRTLCSNSLQITLIEEVLDDFREFEVKNSEVMKEPDSHPDCGRAATEEYARRVRAAHDVAIRRGEQRREITDVEKMKRKITEIERVEREIAALETASNDVLASIDRE